MLDNLPLGAYEAMEANDAKDRQREQAAQAREEWIEEAADDYFAGRDDHYLNAELHIFDAMYRVIVCLNGSQIDKLSYEVHLLDAKSALEQAVKDELGAIYDRKQRGGLQ